MPQRKKRRKRAITAEDLLRVRLAEDPQISPDGERIVYVRRDVDEAKNIYRTNLWMVRSEAGNGGARAFTSSGKDSHPRWSPDGTRLAFLSAREKRAPQVYLIPADGGEAEVLTSFPEGTLSDFRWSPDGTRLAVRFREEDPLLKKAAVEERKKRGGSTPPRIAEDVYYRMDGDGYHGSRAAALYIVDVATGEHRRLFDRDRFGSFGYDFSPDGKQLAVTAIWDPRPYPRIRRTKLWIVNAKTGKRTEVQGLPEGPKDSPRWSPNGKYIAFAGREGDDDTYSTFNLELWVCDPKKRRARCVSGREDYCLMAAEIADMAEPAFDPRFQWTPDSRRLLVSLGWQGETHIAAIKPGGGPFQFLTRGARNYGMGNLSADGRRMALTVGGSTRPADVHLGSMDGDAIGLERRTDQNAALFREVEVAKPKSHWARAADGHRVHFWSLVGPGSPRRRRPGVLQVHGGPHAMYGVSFFHEMQLLAAEGYAVFYSNPRGSKGYGQDHCAAIRGAWGTKDWEDVQAVADFMVEQPFVDPKRTAIMGGSYGGYMTNWAIGHTRRFRCAITDRCVSNLQSAFLNSDYVEEPDHYWPGNSWDRPEARWAQSPIRTMGTARTPTLIIHSEGDLRCNIEQSEQVFSVLQYYKVPSRFVRYPVNTSHGMSRNGPPDMRLHRLGEIRAWLNRWIGKGAR